MTTARDLWQGSELLRHILVRLRRDEIRLIWCLILVQESDDYGDRFPLGQWATPGVHDDPAGDFGYGEWFRRGIRYLAFEGGHTFAGLRPYRDGRIEVVLDGGYYEPRNVSYVSLFAHHKMQVEHSLRRAIDFAEREALTIPVDRLRELYEDVVQALSWAVDDVSDDEVRDRNTWRRRALASIGVTIPGQHVDLVTRH
jgi:hypothetical protein